MIAIDGERVAERGYRGHNTDAPTNIKSASKVIVSALVGIAIERGNLDDPDQPVAPLLAADLPRNRTRDCKPCRSALSCRCRPAWSGLLVRTTASGFRTGI